MQWRQQRKRTITGVFIEYEWLMLKKISRKSFMKSILTRRWGGRGTRRTNSKVYHMEICRNPNPHYDGPPPWMSISWQQDYVSSTTALFLRMMDTRGNFSPAFHHDIIPWTARWNPPPRGEGDQKPGKLGTFIHKRKIHSSLVLRKTAHIFTFLDSSWEDKQLHHNQRRQRITMDNNAKIK